MQRTAPRPILLVESNPEVRHAMMDWLSRTGYAVLTAIDGADAIAKLRAGSKPCLILLDLQSPQSLEFRRAQMQDPQTTGVPVAVYSGLYDPRLARAQLRASAYFYAPFDMTALQKVIDAHCRKYPRRHVKRPRDVKNGNR